MRLPNLSHILDFLAGRRQALDGDDDPEIGRGDYSWVDDEAEGDDSPPVFELTPLPRKPPRALLIEGTTYPKAAALLEEMEAVWRSLGATDDRITPVEFCALPKVPGRPVAILPRVTWPHKARLIREVWGTLRDVCGPLSVRGVRPAQYNAAVGGSRGSRHQWGQAYDLRASTPAKLERLKLEAARLYLQRGRELKLGLGVYRGNIHIDVGHRRRTWGDAARWLKKARRA
jgi:hypothetical protein